MSRPTLHGVAHMAQVASGAAVHKKLYVYQAAIVLSDERRKRRSGVADISARTTAPSSRDSNLPPGYAEDLQTAILARPPSHHGRHPRPMPNLLMDPNEIRDPKSARTLADRITFCLHDYHRPASNREEDMTRVCSCKSRSGTQIYLLVWFPMYVLQKTADEEKFMLDGEPWPSLQMFLVEMILHRSGVCALLHRENKRGCCGNAGTVHTYFISHTPHEKERKLLAPWAEFKWCGSAGTPLWAQDLKDAGGKKSGLDPVRQYFGSDIAFYFLFLGVCASAGHVCFVSNDIAGPAFCVFMRKAGPANSCKPKLQCRFSLLCAAFVFGLIALWQTHTGLQSLHPWEQ
eukprot:SAG11_NODE_1787_length_4257_cov_2.349928_2_plen_345_part_00